MILSSLGLVFLLIAIAIFTYAIIYITFDPAVDIFGGGIALAGAFFISGPLWLLSTILYVAGYLASRNTRSRSLAILFIAGGVINLFNGLALASLLVFSMIQYIFSMIQFSGGIFGVEWLLLSLLALFLPPFIAAIILILAGIALISMGKRRKI
jgi:hypothetical protein